MIASGNSLRLELGEGGWIDVDLFEQNIKEAEEARRSGDHPLYLDRLIKAEALYDREFLSEDLYEDWCQPIRKRLREEYLDVLQNIAEEYLRIGDEKKALIYIEKASPAIMAGRGCIVD